MMLTSSGILLYRRVAGSVEVLLLHHGGPFWARKDEGAWTIPKGLQEPGEEPLAAARREFEEETGHAVEGPFMELGTFRQNSSKTVAVWAAEGAFDVADLKSNMFELEWPPRSGRRQQFPEADRAGWFSPEAAIPKLAKGQAPIIGALLERLGEEPI
ncbi:MAG: NUDIX domain-containing protein [Devosia nanyangense]|nr:NUDIX domain-containing protein [Devosia nanyangense]